MQCQPSSQSFSNIFRSSIRELFAAFLRWFGIPLLVRNTICRRLATIIVYHDPTPKNLERHLKYLSKRYEFISLSTLVRALRQNRWDEIPPKALVLTLDDGNRNNFDLIDIFKRYNVCPTVFVCSHIVGTRRHFWWTDTDTLENLVKKMPHKDAELFLQENTGYSPEKEYEKRIVLNETELKALHTHAEIGSHTCLHPILVNCDDDTCWQETSNSKLKLEEIMNARISHFSYPNGDYDRREARYAAQAGYASARSLDVGWVSRKADPYRLKAMCVQDDASINVLVGQVSGLFQYLHYLPRGGWHGRRPWGIS